MRYPKMNPSTRVTSTWWQIVPLPLLCLLLVGSGCGPEEQQTKLSSSHAYMDSVRAMLGEVRLMDHELSQVVAGQENVSAGMIIPVIRQKLHPTLTTLRERAGTLKVWPETQDAQDLFLSYLDKRLSAYDAALQAQQESRPELFEQFSIRQIEAETLGRELEDVLRRLRTEIPGYH